jgi:hypothetical protein
MRRIQLICFGRQSITQFLLASAAFFSTIAIAQAECSRSPFRFDFGVPSVSSQWRMDRDSECTQTIRGAQVEFKQLTIVQRPAHGRAGVYSTFTYAFKPAAGFVGTDHFAVLIKFSERGVEAETTATLT